MQSTGTNKVLRKRDVIMLAIIALAIYMSLESNSFDYRLDPAWFLDQRQSSGGQWKRLAPVITDLDGDGSNEIVLITSDLTLKVLSADHGDQLTERIYTPKEISSTKLSHFNIKKGRIPIILKTGYVDPYNPSTGRNQIIVVVREDWTVSCFNSKLESLWEKSISHKIHKMESLADKYEISDISVFFTALSIHDHSNSTSTSTGMIIIGASMSLRDSAKADVHVEDGLNSNSKSKSNSNSKDEKLVQEDLEAIQSLEHYSVYALDGHDGSVIWQHDGSEVRAEQFSRALPQHAYRLDTQELARQIHHGVGINDWTVFRQSLLSELPHSWRSREDGSSRLAHFVRRHLGVGAGQQSGKHKKGVANSDQSGKRRAGRTVTGHGRFTGIETEPLASNAVLPHHASEHMSHPNVLVAHTKKGIEVMSIRTGLPITSLGLAADRTYADVDGDGVVDTIMVLETDDDVATHGMAFAHESGELQRCSVMVLSGLPPHTQLFNGTVCVRRVSMHDSLALSKSRLPETVAAVTPLVLSTRVNPTSRDAKVMDVIVAVSIGVVTCYSGEGVYRWQVTDAPSWAVAVPVDSDRSLDQDKRSRPPAPHASVLPFDWDAQRVEESGTHDSSFAQVMVLGDSKLALISRTGDILTSADIPKLPVTRPVFGDFDDDGIIDVIVVTADAVFGYRLEVTPSAKGMLIAFLVLIVLAAVIFVANVKSEIVHDSSRAGGGGGKQKSVMSMVRSTDDWHID
eukprot:gene5268-10538_t